MEVNLLYQRHVVRLVTKLYCKHTVHVTPSDIFGITTQLVLQNYGLGLLPDDVRDCASFSQMSRRIYYADVG